MFILWGQISTNREQTIRKKIRYLMSGASVTFMAFDISENFEQLWSYKF